MSNIFEKYAEKTSNTLAVAGEAEMSGIFWANNVMSESAFTAIAQPLFYGFGALTLVKMLIDSGKSYEAIYIDKPKNDLIQQMLSKFIDNTNNTVESWPQPSRLLAKSAAHTLSFIIHFIKTQVADILINPELKWEDRALKLANLAILVVCFGAASAAISQAAPIIFLCILAIAAIANIYKLKEKTRTEEASVISEKIDLALTVINFAATITAVVGLFLLPSIGIVSEASKIAGVVGASLQGAGVALAFKNAYNNWGVKQANDSVSLDGGQEDLDSGDLSGGLFIGD